jgi:hypothetical protein
MAGFEPARNLSPRPLRIGADEEMSKMRPDFARGIVWVSGSRRYEDPVLLSELLEPLLKSVVSRRVESKATPFGGGGSATQDSRRQSGFR